MASRLFRRLVSLATLLVLGLIPSIVGAEGSVKVRITRNAAVLQNGNLSCGDLFAELKVKCDPGIGDVLEAFVTVHQQPVFGEGFFGPVCDGRRHRHIVQVQSFDGTFQPGEAFASVLILICDADDNCVDGQASRVIEIHSLDELLDDDD